MISMSDLNAALDRFTTTIGRLLGNKVDKVEGKQLSTEDYTTEEKEKLGSVKSMAMRNLYMSTEEPTDDQGEDGDIWIVLKTD